VREIDLSFSTIGDALAKRIAACVHLRFLRRLNLGFSSLTDEGAKCAQPAPNAAWTRAADISK